MEETYKCPNCNRAYAHKSGLYRHIREKHTVQDKKYKCQQCKCEYTRKYGLKKHIDAKHNPDIEGGVKKYICTQCPKIYMYVE